MVGVVVTIVTVVAVVAVVAVLVVVAIVAVVAAVAVDLVVEGARLTVKSILEKAVQICLAKCKSTETVRGILPSGPI